MRIVKKLYDNFDEYCCVAAVALMIVCLALQIVFRAAVGGGLSWSEELSRYSFIWAVFLGMSLAAKRLAHVRITAALLLLPLKARLLVRMGTDALWIAFSLYIAFHGLELLREGLEFPEMSPTLGIVKAWVEAIIPFCFFLTPWRIVEQYCRNIHRGTLLELVRDEVTS